MPEESPPSPAAAYDEMAETYASEVEQSPYNANVDFPGTTALVPDVAGKRVLDAGCGAGRYTEWLLAQGAAEVVGVDASAGMLAQARDRLQPADDDRVHLQRADLGEPLPVADDSFEGIVSALAVGYVPEWEPLFAEFARVLAPGGFLVVSTAHPVDVFPLEDDENYFDVERRVKDWAVEVPFYRRPLERMLNPLLAAGFRLETVSEPQPTETFRERWPERYEKESRHPVFLAWRAVLPAD